MWYVVNFIEEDTVEAVPASWYRKETRTCFWPDNENLPRSRLLNYIRHEEYPESNWNSYSANVLGSYDTYNLAENKANKAKNTNKLTSSEDNEKGRGLRKKYLNKSYKSVHSNISEASSDGPPSSEDDTMYPRAPKKKTVGSSQPKTTVGSSQPKTTVPSKISQECEPERTHLEKREYEVFAQIYKELSIINLKLNDIGESMNILLEKNRAVSVVQERTQEEEVLLKLYNTLPLTQHSLPIMEKLLFDSDENKKILAKELGRIGGSSVKDTTKRIMYKLFTNELGALYSWEGAKGKKTFKNLLIANVVLDAVRNTNAHANATDYDTIGCVKAWLVRCKDRIKQNKDKKNQNNDLETGEQEVEEQFNPRE